MPRDRAQEFIDYTLAMAEIKGVELTALAERLGEPADVLYRRSQQPEYHEVRKKVMRTAMASSLCRVKLQERAVELVERMTQIALGELKARPSEIRMLLGLRDILLPTALHQAVTQLADAGANTQRSIARSMDSHIEKLQELAPPKRTIDTPILRGKDALPIALKLHTPTDSD